MPRNSISGNTSALNGGRKAYQKFTIGEYHRGIYCANNRSIVEFDGGNLEKPYNKLKSEFDDSEQAAAKIPSRISSVEDVADDLFDEWQKELASYTSDRLRRDSASKLSATKAQYQRLIKTMRRAEKSVTPVLNTLRDQTLYLKHNPNARAIDSLKGELKTIDSDANRLIDEMQKSTDAANQFIEKIKT